MTLPSSITTIDDSAFYACGLYSLNTSIILSDNITSIGAGAFLQCKISFTNLPSKLQSIGRLAFGNNTSLTNINFPSTLIQIDSSAFTGCSNLNKLTFNGNCPTIAPDAFNAIASNLTIYYNKNYPCYTDTTINFFNVFNATGRTVTKIPF